jgi:signal transduction histidine kinase
MALSSGFHKNDVGKWLFLGTTAIAVFSATLATIQLQNWSNQAAHYKLQLSRLQASTNRLDALEWRGIAQQKIDSDLQSELEEQRLQSEAILIEIKTRAASPENLQRVSSVYKQYVNVVNQLLGLLKAGEIAEALEVDEEKVDPNYEKLREVIVEESAKASHTAETVGNYALVGAILTSLTLITVISIVFHRYQQANQKAQLAMVEQESMRRSEQVLKQEQEVLETKVRDRTQALEEKNATLTQVLSDLKQSQLHLIQSEKMSSLGQLVAGVAHEINNPVSFIRGNVFHAAKYTQGLLQLIDLYQSEYVDQTPAIQAKINDIELSFIQQDSKKLFDSMEMGTNRIQNIVLSLRNFSRLDESDFKMADLHEGIDNTLLILASRLNAVGDRPAIQVIKHYGSLSHIECYAGHLNQVFMNLLSNAIDALRESNQGQTYKEIEDHPNTIWIQTEVTNDDHIKITIADNGSGISENMRSRLFDPFFTTKPVGKGTGLGLSISYQIITEQHNGKLYCDSILGEGTKFYIEIPVQQPSKLSAKT